MSRGVLEFGWGKLAAYLRREQNHALPHVHVRGPGAEASFDLETLELLAASGFDARTLGKIQKTLLANHEAIKEKWDEIKSED